MANIADCAIRIATEDFDKFSKIMRIVPASQKSREVYEALYTREVGNTQEQYKCIVNGTVNLIGVSLSNITEAYKKVDNKWKKVEVDKLPTKEIKVGYVDKHLETVLDAYYTTSKPLVWEEVVLFGACRETPEDEQKALLIDFTEVIKLANGDYPRIMEIWAAECDGSAIEIDFNAKWDFPEPLERVMNMLANADDENVAQWQGAVAEPGTDSYTDEIGTSDLGLVIKFEACCSDCNETYEEDCATKEEAYNTTCEDCKDEKGNPVHCYPIPFVSSNLGLDF